EDVLLLAAGEAGAVVEHLDRVRGGAAGDVAAGRGVVDGVLDDGVDRAVEVGAGRPRVAGAVVLGGEGDLVGGGGALPAAARVGGGGGPGGRLAARLGPGG